MIGRMLRCVICGNPVAPEFPQRYAIVGEMSV